MANFVSTPLYGGAIVADLPTGYGDVSQIRQVPDNQEVYLKSTGFTSIVFDILERIAGPEASTDEEALKYHFNDLVSGTGDDSTFLMAGEARLGKMQTTPTYILSAVQTPPALPPNAPPSRHPQPDFTAILLTLIRLPAQTTDIVVTVNVPHNAGEYNREDVDLPAQKFGPLVEEAMAIRQKVLESFEVKDFNLFG